MNPIRHTVAHFIEAGALRQLRQESRKAKHSSKNKIQKSNFVRYMESLENRSPILMGPDVFKKWTKQIHAEMLEAGTWLTPQAKPSTQFVAEYVSRLQRQFWNENPKYKWYDRNPMELIERNCDELRISLRTVRLIYEKIRAKGMRDRNYFLRVWQYSISPWWTCVADNNGRGNWNTDTSINIRPWIDYNDHGGGI